MIIKESELRSIVRNTIVGMLKESIDYDDDDEMFGAEDGDDEPETNDFADDLDYDSEPSDDDIKHDQMFDDPTETDVPKSKNSKLDAILYRMYQQQLASRMFKGSFDDFKDKCSGRGGYSNDYSSDSYGDYDDENFY